MTERHLNEGANSAGQLQELVARHHPSHGHRPLALLNVAAGQGHVTRHLAMSPGFTVSATNLPAQQLDLFQNTLGVRAIPTCEDPEDFLTSRFDVIVALSVFSHLPDTTWSRWLAALYYHLERDGLLILATNGRAAHAGAGHPRLHPDGYHVVPAAEQSPGLAIVTPGYVIDRIDRCPNAELVAFESAFWCRARDLWIVRKTVTPFARNALAERAGLQAEIAALAASRETLLGSTSWRLTAPLRALGRLLPRL